MVDTNPNPSTQREDASEMVGATVPELGLFGVLADLAHAAADKVCNSGRRTMELERD